MLGGIQPEPLIKIAGDAADDGFLQRLFPIMLRTPSVGQDEPMPPINDRYKNLISFLREISPPRILEVDFCAPLHSLAMRCELGMCCRS